jgi:hypothetical protein
MGCALTFDPHSTGIPPILLRVARLSHMTTSPLHLTVISIANLAPRVESLSDLECSNTNSQAKGMREPYLAASLGEIVVRRQNPHRLPSGRAGVSEIAPDLCLAPAVRLASTAS